MPDYGSRVTDKAVADTAKRVRETYRIAQRELREKLKDFEKRHERIDREKRQKLADGKITLAEYKTWLSGQVFIRKQWENQIKQVSETLRRSNEEAVKIINERRLDVFAENYNYTAFHAEAVTGINFNIYNTQAVAKLIQDDPQILPEWKIDEEKDYQWDYRKVNNIVQQGIIQGESIPEISSRLVTDLCAMSARKMMMFARTAYTGAQNAGRQQQMDEAAKLGIEQHKVWIAVFDNRTRDAHRDLDGQEVPYDKPFDSQLGPIRFPGDPSAEPANVYNCRCQMVTIYPEYDDGHLRTWRDNETVDGMTYQEWKQGKKKRNEVVQPYDRAAAIKDIVAQMMQNAFNGDVPDGCIDAVERSLENADSKMLQIVQKTIGGVTIDWMENNPNHNISCYTEGSGHIQIITKDSAGETRTTDDLLRTFWHEYGHYVDDAGVSGSGYGYKSEYGDYFFHGIQAEILKDDKWMYAAMEDTNKLLQFAGLDDHYECRFENGMYSASVFRGEQWVDARNPDFNIMNELEDGLTKWVNHFSEYISLDDYRKQFGYPTRPERSEYIETYFTPKRNLYRERELFKGARDAYNAAVRKYYDDVDAFEKTHDMGKINNTWHELAKKAEKRKGSVAPATDTFDGGVGGAFFAFILHGGHEPRYYAYNRMGAKEGIANVFSALMTQDNDVLDAMMGLCPNVFNLIKGVILK